MKLCQFKGANDAPSPGLVLADQSVLDLSRAGVSGLNALLESDDLNARLEGLARQPALPRRPLRELQLLAPVDGQEVWAAGVTYLRSKAARMEESDFSANAYDRVYAADRPELFFKSLPEKVVHPGEPVGIRKDAVWNVPEPELALVINSRGVIVGCTIGNDMSSRDIEGENVLYLPQAKIYHRSCALGPVITVGAPESEIRSWTITLGIDRKSERVFSGSTTVSQIKRSFEELAQFLFRSQVFPRGAILLTGTGIVPPEGFSLAEGDTVQMEISGIGSLINPVVRV
jgi:2-dehydro-3-deoxy-D-arabinonate dehydratase